MLLLYNTIQEHKIKFEFRIIVVVSLHVANVNVYSKI